MIWCTPLGTPKYSGMRKEKGRGMKNEQNKIPSDFFSILTRFSLLTLSSTFILPYFLRSNTSTHSYVITFTWYLQFNGSAHSQMQSFLIPPCISRSKLLRVLQRTSLPFPSHSSLFTFSHFTDTKLTVLFALFVPFCVSSSFLLPLFRPLFSIVWSPSTIGRNGRKKMWWRE